MKQYNASLELANIIQLNLLSSYETSKADTQKIAENDIENWSEKKLLFHHVKVVCQASIKLIMGGMHVRTPFTNLKKCLEKNVGKRK